MKKFIWISLVFFLLSCANSRKVHKNLESVQTKTETQGSTETKAETTTEISDKTLLDFFETNTNFGIKPIGDTPAKFVFIHNGQKIEGETTGELNFNQQQTKINQVTETVKKIHTVFQTKTFYKTVTTFKTVLKEKQSEAKRSSFAWYVLSFVLGMAFVILVKILWKNYGPGIIDRFKNGKIQ